MIRPSYALKLASTKLRSKRGVLVTSVIVASLMFGVLIATVIVFSAAEKSATKFIKKAGNDRYLVKAQPNIPNQAVGYTNPPSLEDIRELKAYEKQYYQELREKYTSLGIEYDKSSEISALIPDAAAPRTLPEEQRVRLDWTSPVVAWAENHKFAEYAKTAMNKANNLRDIGNKYGATGYNIAGKPSLLLPIPSLRLIQDDVENFSDVDIETGDSTNYGIYTNAIHNGYYNFTDQKLLGRYLLTTDSANLKGVPVIVSAQEAVSLFGERLGIGKEPSDSNAKREWLKNVQAKMNGQTYQVCYRNSAEQSLLEKIQRDYAEMENNKGVSGYQRPHLIYDYPKNACGDIRIKADTRTVAEKQAEMNAENIKKKLGAYVAPAHRLLTFQIVGIKYAQPYMDYTKGIGEYVKSLLIFQDGLPAIDIPYQMYESLPGNMKIDDMRDSTSVPKQGSDDDFVPRVLEFSTVTDAREFLDNESCPNYTSGCDKKFFASPYDSNYLILDEIGKLFNRIAGIAFPSVLGLAAIIIWFTISRIMTENRKETAVYRAMGAKRRDVTSVYLIYVLLVALRIAVVALIVGILIALTIDYLYGKIITDMAVTAFGIVDDAPEFSLFDLTSPLLAVILGSIFVISIIASIQPLIRNIMRSPIRDIREE